MPGHPAFTELSWLRGHLDGSDRRRTPRRPRCVLGSRLSYNLQRTQMTQDFGWLGPASTKQEPSLEHVCRFWTLRGPSGRDIVCSAYRSDTGLELRTEYGPEDMVASQLFRGDGADERLAETADQWRRVLIAKGFHEMAT